jgi:two-component sensor histidine kinase
LEPIMAGRGDGTRVDLSGCATPGVILLPSAALMLAMALHELATNALKHGALSLPGGHISITCRIETGGGSTRVVDWTERGGPLVTGPPARRGFGLRLLERGLAAGAGVQADLHFEPEGVRCSLWLKPKSLAAPVGPDR